MLSAERQNRFIISSVLITYTIFTGVAAFLKTLDPKEFDSITMQVEELMEGGDKTAIERGNFQMWTNEKAKSADGR